MSKIKIDFVNFWIDFNKTNNYFYNLLSEDFEIEISNQADFIFYSVFNFRQGIENYNCKKIFYVGENIEPPLDECDLAFSFSYIDDPKHYRLPLYVLYLGYDQLDQPKNITQDMADRKFCNFICSNPSGLIRNKFVEKLSQYKQVDCGGGWMNNLGYIVDNKREFQSKYKFSIAMENFGQEGYLTEKILDPMTVNSMPIYWGDPLVHYDFNPLSFVNVKDIDEAIEYIIELDNNPDKYIEMLQQPWLHNNVIPQRYTKEKIKDFIYKNIIDTLYTN